MYLGFPQALLGALRCPADSAAFIPSAGSGTHVRSMFLECSVCHVRRAVRDGIVMLLDEEGLPSLTRREMGERDKQAIGYDSHFSDRQYREVAPVLREVGSVSGKRVIEYGAGTGRITEQLSQNAELYLASDVSLESLLVLAGKELPSSVGLVCAEATALSTAEDFFDIAVAFQLIEHITQRSDRERLYGAVARALVPGGVFVASVYHQSLRRRVRRLLPDGEHANGIPYHFFRVAEFRSELVPHFVRAFARPIDIMLPLERRLGLSAPMEGIVSQVLEKVPVLNQFGHLILAKAERAL